MTNTIHKPNEMEVLATTLPAPDYSGWEGWYCHSGYPVGEALANAADRERCWGCGTARADGGTPKGLGTAVTVLVPSSPNPAS